MCADHLPVQPERPIPVAVQAAGPYPAGARIRGDGDLNHEATQGCGRYHRCPASTRAARHPMGYTGLLILPWQKGANVASTLAGRGPAAGATLAGGWISSNVLNLSAWPCSYVLTLCQGVCCWWCFRPVYARNAARYSAPPHVRTCAASPNVGDSPHVTAACCTFFPADRLMCAPCGASGGEQVETLPLRGGAALGGSRLGSGRPAGTAYRRSGGTAGQAVSGRPLQSASTHFSTLM
jgi:hypothetical protein